MTPSGKMPLCITIGAAWKDVWEACYHAMRFVNVDGTVYTQAQLREIGMTVEFTFNGIRVQAGPGDGIQDLQFRYYRDLAAHLSATI